MKKLIVLLFVLALLLAELYPAKRTLQLNLKGKGDDQVHTLNCHVDFYTFIEVEKEEEIKRIIFTKNGDWEIERDGPFIWIRPKNEEGVETSLAIVTESGKIYVFTLKIVENEEIFYPKIFITSEEK
jgi:type IV secretory pathway VirB9-like protein